MELDDLDKKLVEVFEGRCVRKDLVQRLKKGTNIPTFVLEFLLARYCATDDPDEIEAGITAVVETIQNNYVRPNEANSAQSKVQQKKRHQFIDKVHVRHNERERRHWAEMQNFGSKRIAINERHYAQNSRLLEGGLWCEVTVAYNDVEEDDYAFFIEELRPIQISRFSYEDFCEGRKAFTAEEWQQVILRSIGLEPSVLKPREQLHLLARLFPLIEQNYNYLELGPRGTGKSYVYSEFTPYSTLVSGGQTSTATLFYNKQRKEVGIIGYWDTVAFDEVAGIKIKDPGTITILKDFMANGHFNVATEVAAPASLAFVGNIDDAIDQLVSSYDSDLCKPLPKEFDLAVIHRFHTFTPGWEIPPNGSHMLTSRYGLITDYLAEAFHYLFNRINLFTKTKSRLNLNNQHEGRDETAVIKTVSALCKLLHPGLEIDEQTLEKFTNYGIEGRRRIKEQLNKRKKDYEFSNIDLGFTDSEGKVQVVDCPESENVAAVVAPRREGDGGAMSSHSEITGEEIIAQQPIESVAQVEPQEKEIRIFHGDRGYSFRTLFLPYLKGSKKVTVEDPYIRLPYQATNFLRFCEVCAEAGTIENIKLKTSYDNEFKKQEIESSLITIQDSLTEHGINLEFEFKPSFHDRRIEVDEKWIITLGRGLDIYQKPETWMSVGANELELRPCNQTNIVYARKK